jgi:ribonucleoside-diphosphate reductase alpha chain
MSEFRTEFGRTIFQNKYANPNAGIRTWAELCDVLVYRVCHKYMNKGDMTQLSEYMRTFKFIPAGRYLYYAGRQAAFFNNCFGFEAEDSREGWADLGYKHFMALMSGGGVGTAYGKVRPEGEIINRTGGTASGPMSLMYAMNEIGRNVQQGGSRRSALYASLPWDHQDWWKFSAAKDWSEEVKTLKAKDFNFPAPLDMTNISTVYNSQKSLHSMEFYHNVLQACKTGEPGFQFDLFTPEEVIRNACAEFISAYDSDMCNLGSLNLSRIMDMMELADVTYLASQFLYCGSLEAELPLEKCYKVRKDHRKIGLGLMGVHEWLLRKGYKYEVPDELCRWLSVYERASEQGADNLSKSTGESPCERYRSVAPAGTISILAGTTSGIEPLFATGIKRRYLRGSTWEHQYIVEPLAKFLVQERGIPLELIETSNDLSQDIERRIQFQVDIQEYVDMGISSTINLPAWGTEFNNSSTIHETAEIIRKHAPALRGLTFYPDGSRGGQPLTQVPYQEALEKEGSVFTEDLEFLETTSCPSGACGI